MIKIKKFNNLWTMGIIIMATLFIGFEILKLVYPQFVIGIAEYKSVVDFGNYVQSNLWAYYLFVGFTSFATYTLICCACCRKTHLNLKENLIILAIIVVLFLVQKFANDYYFGANILSNIMLPLLFCAIDKNRNLKCYSSIFSVILLHNLFQVLSLKIRDLSLIISSPNIVTLTILCIDMFIWLGLLYNYSNFKECK